MKSSDRKILIVIGAIGLVAAMWMLVISPKRSELADLDKTAQALSDEVTALEAEAAAGEAAKQDFSKNYARMVVLGKAVPGDDEEADLIYNLDQIGTDADVEFRSISLGSGSDIATPEIVRPNPATGEEPTTPAEPGTTAEGATTETAAAPVDATEAAASTLPIGATLGPAGLGVMPWDITFDGDYFDLNRVFDQIDHLVHFDSGSSKVNGRLITVDGFALERIDDAIVPRLKAVVAVRSFVAPKDQGVMLGATPAGPAPSSTAPVSATTTEVAP